MTKMRSEKRERAVKVYRVQMKSPVLRLFLRMGKIKLTHCNDPPQSLCTENSLKTVGSNKIKLYSKENMKKKNVLYL